MLVNDVIEEINGSRVMMVMMMMIVMMRRRREMVNVMVMVDMLFLHTINMNTHSST